MTVFMDFVHWWTVGRASATAAVAAGCAAVTSASFAVRAFRANQRAVQRTHRPVVCAHLELIGQGTIGIVFRNVSNAVARDVEVAFDPPLPPTKNSTNGMPSLIPYLEKRFTHPIGTWAPGQTLRGTYWLKDDDNTDDSGQSQSIDRLSRDTEAVINYADDDGNQYTERYSLDPTPVEGETWSVHKKIRKGETEILSDGAPWHQ